MLEAENGETLLDILERERIEIRSDCGGKGKCGKCGVLVDNARHVKPLNEAGGHMLESGKNGRTFRLACQTRVTGDIALEIPRFYFQLSDNQSKTRINKRFPVNHGVRRWILPAEKARNRSSARPPNLKTRIQERVFQTHGLNVRFDSPHAVRELSRVSAGDEMTLVCRDGEAISALSGVKERSLGFAADIGTTTIAVYLCDMRTGDVLTALADTNPQGRYGGDVVTRIGSANLTSTAPAALQNLAVGGVNALMRECLTQAGADENDVDAVAVTGNTVMLHLFSGLSPSSIGVYPYTPVVSRFPDYTASDLGLELRGGVPVRIMPAVSGFVGGDAIAAALAAGIRRSEEICLIADLGTNGELILGNKDGLWAASCATGPAFEGGHIACGMRAAPGAAYHFDIDSSGRIVYETIGASHAPPIGICGSGLIDAIAVLLRTGRVLPSGAFADSRPEHRARPGGRKITLIPSQSEPENEIYLTLKDIRQIQLAKAALSSGIKMLMKKSGISKIDRTILTGAFGVAFNQENAAAIGMLPPEAVYRKIVSAENLAGEGAVRVLLDADADREAFVLADAVQYVEISAEPGFADQFVADLSFPEPSEKRKKTCAF